MAWWNDVDYEGDAQQRYDQERQKLEQYARTYRDRPEVARNIRVWARHAPFLPRGIISAFAKADVDPSSRLGKWAVTTASVALDTRDQAGKSNTLRAEAIRNTHGVISFLANTGKVAELADFDRKALEKLEDVGPDVFNYTSRQLGRMKRHKDPTEEPSGLRGIFHDVGDVATTGIRTGFAGMQAGTEAVDMAFRGAISGVAGVADPRQREAALSAAGGQPSPGDPVPEMVQFGNVQVSTDPSVLFNPKQITLYNYSKGEGMGHGFLPNPAAPAGVTQAAAAREAGFVELPEGGRRDLVSARLTEPTRSALTPGRFIAQTIVEPGTVPYNLISGLADAWVDWKGDPANFSLESWGAYKGARKYIIPEKFSQQLDSRTGASLLQRLADETSIRTLNRKLNRTGHFPAELLAPLQEAKTPAAVRDILEGTVMSGAAKIPRTARKYDPLRERIPRAVGFDWKKSTQDWQWTHDMPNGVLHVDDVGNNLEQIEKLLVLGKAEPEDIERVMSRAARTETMSDLGDLMFHDVNNVLRKKAVDEFHMSETDFRQGFRFMDTTSREIREFVHDDLGNPLHMDVPFSNGEESFPILGPHVEADLLNKGIPIPDLDRLRKMRHRMSVISKVPIAKKVWNSNLAFGSIAAADFIFGDIWKPLALLRGAWTVRVVGEEQIRMAADGMDSMVNHPGRAISWVVGRRGGTDVMEKDWRQLANATQGEDMLFARAQVGRGKGSMVDIGRGDLDRYTVSGWGTHPRYSDSYTRAWADRITHNAASPTYREVARDLRDNGSLDRVKELFWAGGEGDLHGLKPIREKMMRANLWQEEFPGGSAAVLSTREGSDAFINSVKKSIDNLTGDDPDLLEAFASGKNIDWSPEGAVATKELTDQLKNMEAVGQGPNFINGPTFTQSKQRLAGLDKFVQWAFNGLMTVETNKLSRSPAFRQTYWKNVKELLPYADEATQAELIRVGRKNKIKMKLPGTSGAIAHADVDLLAKGRALDHTRDLLYDITNKGNGWDALRFVFPFGEAFKEVTTRWAKLVYDKPHLIRRGQQVVQGARGAGFWYTDPDDGQEYFTYPFSGKMTQAVTGVLGGGEGLPFDLRGRVQSLNVIGSGLPAVGPGMQLLAEKVVPQDEKWDWLNDYIDPYGSVESDMVDALLPGWVKRMRTGGWLESIGLLSKTQEDERIFENAVKDASMYLASTGKYNLDSGEGLNELVDDARQMAKGLYFWRGAAQFVAPAAPQAVPKMKGKDGRLYEIYVIADDYQKMKDRHDGDWAAATEEFVETYGATAYLALEPRGRREVYGVPTTHQAEVWRMDHTDFADSYPEVYGYFAPQGGDFDPRAYERAVARGEIKAQDTETWIRLANDRVASAKYASVRATFPTNTTTQDDIELAKYQDGLVDKYEGYKPKTLSGQTATDDLIHQLFDASNHKSVRNTEIAKRTREYLKFRDQALAEIGKGRGRSGSTVTLTSKAASPFRAWLRGEADALARETPEWTAIYDGILSGEVRITDEELAGGG